MVNSKKLGLVWILVLALAFAPAAFAAGTESAVAFNPIEWLQAWAQSLVEDFSSPAAPSSESPTRPPVDSEEGSPLIIPSG